MLEKVRTALLAMREKDLVAIHAIDPNYEQWISILWEDYAPVEQAMNAVHGIAFYELND